MKRYPLTISLIGLLLAACGDDPVNTPTPGADAPEAPVAAKRPTTLSLHGVDRVDEYYWMRDRDDPEVIAYLEAENAYVDAVMADTETLQEALYGEIRARIREDDRTAPYRYNGYWYYTRYERGDEYPIHARRRGSLEAPEEIILDVRELARGNDYAYAGGLDVSPDNRWLVYGFDNVGRRLYELFVKDLETGTTYPLGIDGAAAGGLWSGNGETLFYVMKDPQTLRTHRVYRVDVAAGEPGEPVLVFDETDETFSVDIDRTTSGEYLTIESLSTVSTEVRLIGAGAPAEAPRVFLERKRDHEYHVDHDGERFFVITNDNAKNFRVAATDTPGTPAASWESIVAHRDATLVEGMALFEQRIVVEEKTDGLNALRIVPHDGGDSRLIGFDDAAYTAELLDNYELDAAYVRYGYESMTRPHSVFDYAFDSGESTLVLQDEVLGDYDPERYRTERIFAQAADGERIPVSVVYRHDTPRDGSAPLLQYAYGSYGYSIDPGFSYSRVSLLDRGFVFAIAHIRGGSALGRRWYEDGKLANKKNTFTDFADVTEHLVANGYAAPGAVYAMGGSAGGLLMGAVMNLRPELYRGVVAQVPFVDVVTTMLDDSIPLTTSEFDEWGNPAERDDFDYMLSYSPYDNVAAREYPHVLITSGLHDSQVQYWEPTKWTARLRERKLGDSLVLLKTNMDAGHGGASGRFERLKEVALEYAFLLKLEQRREPS